MKKMEKTTNIALALLVALSLVGCQHIQTARNPMPITLTPSNHQKLAISNTQNTHIHHPIILTPTNLPTKNKSDAKKSLSRTEFYLLESWF